jgi:pimeloyl-ACP methyl ester carboxylesterase
MVIGSRDNPTPEDPAWKELSRHSRDGVPIFGRCLRAGDVARGTLIFVHGFTMNGGSFRDLAYQLRERLGMHIITPDLRHHGRSGDRAPTFGTAESWDIAACLDWAGENGLPRPYSVMGESLGAMAVQRLAVEDARVSNVFCIHPPGWPWDAVGKVVSWNMDGFLGNLPPPLRSILSRFRDKAVGIGNLINASYGFEILRDGDPRAHTPNPPGNPRILYVIGEDDPYEPDKARQVWRHFYPETEAQEGVWPGDAPKQKKYFITVPGFRHFPPGPTVFEWDGFWPLIESFFGND